MPEAILKFDLPDENNEFEMASRANDLHTIIWDLDQELRKKVKYSEEDTEKEREIIDKIRTELWEEITNKGLYHLFQ